MRRSGKIKINDMTKKFRKPRKQKRRTPVITDEDVQKWPPGLQMGIAGLLFAAMVGVRLEVEESPKPGPEQKQLDNIQDADAEIISSKIKDGLI
jgi:hypothetical protein